MFTKPILIVFLIMLFPFFAISQGKIERPSSLNTTSKTKGAINGHSYVDLGLPSGTKWATCNIGTDKFDYYGNLFVWGNPEVVTDDSWSKRPTYYDQSSFAGLLKYDPAAASWGEKWQTPTKEDFIELIDNCIFIWTNDYDGGVWVQSKQNGQKIYLPACGGCSGTQGYDYIGIVGLYWTSNAAPKEFTYKGVTDYAYCMQFIKTEAETIIPTIRTDPRKACLSIRPVSKQ